MSTEGPTTFAALLRHLRLTAGLTQEELAERAQLSERAIRRLERDPDRVPRLQTVRLLAQALHLTNEEQSRLLTAARSGPGFGAALMHVSVLPHSLSPLIGRTEDVALLTLLLEERRLVTVRGTGGVGKTRLALAVAQQIATAFDRVVFVELASVRDADDVSSAIAATLGVREEGGRSLLDRLVTTLRPGRVLLLLDNMEHLLPAGQMILTLLESCPDLSALITSREALHVRGERVYTLGPLPVPERHDDIARSPAVRLFLERARDAGVEIVMDRTVAQVIAEICRRLDGLPLAIELAAAWTPCLPPPALLARLTVRLPYLERGPQDATPRQRTMRETIAWSYDLLDPEEQTLFARLSVFAGGCTLEAVMALGDGQGDRDVLVGLSVLVERSLLRSEGADEPRFIMLETIREYAAEKLAERGEERAIRAAHATYFLEVAEEAERHYYGARSSEFLRRLEADHDNLHAALGWTVGEGDRQQGVRLAGALYRFWEVHGHLAEGRRWLSAILAREDEVGPPAKVLPLREPGKAFPAISGATSPWGRILTGAAVMAAWQGDYGEAARRCQQRLALSRALDDVVGMACALHDLGQIAAHEGDIDSADRYFEECIELDRALGDTASVASTLGSRGMVMRRRGEHQRAIALLEEARALFREVGETPHLPPVLCELASARADQGEMEEAVHLYQECGLLLREMGDKTQLPGWFDGLAALAARQGRHERVIRLGGVAAALRDAIGSPLSGLERREQEEIMGRVRAEIGEEAWRRAWESGQSMTLEEAMAYALHARQE